MDSDIWTDPETGEVNAAWNFKREFDPMSFRILFKTLIAAKYGQIQAIRVWKCKGSDESVRSVCEYLMLPEAECKDLQFTDNNITPLGCEFIGKTLGPIGSKTVNLLKLDYNQFGYAGVAALSTGLSQNATLRHLSLQYCNITEEGGQYIGHILMFKGSVLENLNLRGNYLKEPGIIDVCNGARRCAKLELLDVYDNKFQGTQEVLDAVKDLMVSNKVLKQYDLGGNMISDAGAAQLVQEIVKANVTHLTKVLITERTQSTTSAALLETYAGKKGKKKK
jgi:Ran GTPase-activating protein (RanGAP) involved in mRNA processing and transport